MNIRRLLFSTTSLAGAAALSVALPSLSWAQDQSAAQDAATPGANEVEAVVITGTRLRLPDYTASAPVTSLQGEAIEYSGTTNLTDFLQELPSLQNSVDLQDNANAGDRASAGLNLLDLRNLGSQRTLTLVNGRRHVAGTTGTASVDVNTIPVGLVDRIEVLTGGASATYGADAVTGVVNFILKSDFEGVDARVQSGWSEEGGAENTFGSVLVGHNWMDGRLNATFGYEISRTEPLDRDDRDYLRIGSDSN
jgi:outer membrane cobalamin receptor